MDHSNDDDHHNFAVLNMLINKIEQHRLPHPAIQAFHGAMEVLRLNKWQKQVHFVVESCLLSTFHTGFYFAPKNERKDQTKYVCATLSVTLLDLIVCLMLKMLCVWLETIQLVGI
jgi:hypothetical protein